MFLNCAGGVLAKRAASQRSVTINHMYLCVPIFGAAWENILDREIAFVRVSFRRASELLEDRLFTQY